MYRAVIRIILALSCVMLATAPASAQIKFDKDGKTAELYQEPVTGDVVLTINGAEKLRAKSDGTFISQSGIKVGEDASCAAATEGTVQYVESTNTWKFCDGLGWQVLSVAGGAVCNLVDSPMQFKPLMDVPINTVISSVIKLVQTESCTTPIVISGDGTPQYRICSDKDCNTEVQTWTSANGNVSNGQYIQLRATSSTSGITWTMVTVSMGPTFSRWVMVTAPLPSRVFVTSTGWSGLDMYGVGGADYKCNQLAAAAGIGGNYLAWIADGTGTGDPLDRFDQNPAGYRLRNGTVIATDWNDLIDASNLPVSINMDQTGATVGGSAKVWTNVDQDGEYVHNTRHCDEWSVNAGTAGIHGVTDMVNIQWTNKGQDIACNQSNRLYCFEQFPDPPGTAGTDYKRVFVTSQTYSALNVGGIAGADAKCNSLATAAGLTGTYMAWLSDSTNNPSGRFTQATVPYRMVNGARLADNWSDLTSGEGLQTGVVLNESGAVIGSSQPRIWSNTYYYGSAVSTTNHCNNWTSNAAAIGTYGRVGAVNTKWSSDTTPLGCNQMYRLLCFEQ